MKIIIGLLLLIFATFTAITTLYFGVLIYSDIQEIKERKKKNGFN